MTFSELPYSRPSIEEVRASYDEILRRFEVAGSAEEQAALFLEHETISRRFATLAAIAQVRHTINTADAFYDAENDYFDECGPLLQEKVQKLYVAMLESRFRPALEERFGSLLFENLTIAARCFGPEIVALSQEENQLASEYQKLYASAIVEFDGQKLPLPKLSAYKTNPDRTVRRAAYEAEGRFFDAHREELDTLFDRLVKCRDAQAKALGYNNYVAMGYDALGRNCYTPADVAAFREQIARDFVPVVREIKEQQRRRIGVPCLALYDDVFLFPDGNARPEGTPEDILAAGRQMYHELSPETAAFVDFLYDNELFDVLSREGKAPGGYCTDLPDYKAPFIFSNFNGTAGDVDVLTHEAGHAFAAYRALRSVELSELTSPTIEACEVHSMSMEFLTEPYHHLFFGGQTAKYALGHCEDAATFLPYGCMVDEFQTRVYENPDWTPEERNAFWLSLEEKYRPYMNFEDLPFYSRGAGWQRQLHIYLYPLYYIDYCMAQTVAFQFWAASMRDRKDAWQRYLAFVDLAGTRSFTELVRSAGLRVPYEPGCIREVGQEVADWIRGHQLS